MVWKTWVYVHDEFISPISRATFGGVAISVGIFHQ